MHELTYFNQTIKNAVQMLCNTGWPLSHELLRDVSIFGPGNCETCGKALFSQAEEEEYCDIYK
jgi:hypothetical protein